MRFVEIKSCEQQAALILHRVRLMLMRQRTQLSNAIRGHMAEYGLVAALINEQVLENDRHIRTSARATELGRRLMEVPGVGPLLASAMVAAVPDPRAFKCGRSLAAWIGLVPRQNSSGGKEKLGGITKQGDRYLRQLLVVGAIAVIRYAQRHGTRRPWLVKLLARRTPKIAAVALANKTARVTRARRVSGQR